MWTFVRSCAPRGLLATCQAGQLQDRWSEADVVPGIFTN